MTKLRDVGTVGVPRQVSGPNLPMRERSEVQHDMSVSSVGKGRGSSGAMSKGKAATSDHAQPMHSLQLRGSYFRRTHRPPHSAK